MRNRDRTASEREIVRRRMSGKKVRRAIKAVEYGGRSRLREAKGEQKINDEGNNKRRMVKCA